MFAPWTSLAREPRGINTRRVRAGTVNKIGLLLIIDIIDTPLKGLFSDKKYKHINLLYYYYI